MIWQISFILKFALMCFIAWAILTTGALLY